MEILVVDDSKAMRSIVIRTLRQAGFTGHEVKEAGSGTEALEAIGSSKPDLILCDWNMPEMSGIELLEQLNADGTSIKLGFVTSEGTADMKKVASEAGALFVITKPFTPDNFKDTLSAHIQ